jgi:zinc transporter
MNTPVLHQISLRGPTRAGDETRLLPLHGDQVWTHIDALSPEAGNWLREHSELNDIAIEGLLAEETRPRLVVRQQRLLLILRGVNLNPGADPDDMVSVRIWTDGNCLISAQRRPLQSTADIVDRLTQGEGPETLPNLLLAWVDQLVNRMNDTIGNLEDQVLQLEERTLDNDTDGLRHEFAKLRKQTVVLRRYLAPQRETLFRLANEAPAWLEELQRLKLRETAERLARHIDAIEEVRDRAALAQEELMSQLSEEMNARMYLLSIVAALFLPLGFFTGLLGINVGGMPGTENDQAFWIVVGICVTSLAILGVIFRNKKWV